MKTPERAAAAILLAILIMPLLALAFSASPAAILQGLSHPTFLPALALSLRTTCASLALTLLLGTPLAWWLAQRRSALVDALVQLPIVLPPAVVGVALLQTLGRRGLLGGALATVGLHLPFSASAVVLAQLGVALPFYVVAATRAFRSVDPELLIVARTLGKTERGAWLRVTLPLALPGLGVGAALAWARALGEFGATLVFAGNRPGVTQTMPLAIYAALESDLELAVVFSLVLVAVATLVLVLRYKAIR
jgi:molybdate transport system permease protein